MALPPKVAMSPFAAVIRPPPVTLQPAVLGGKPTVTVIVCTKSGPADAPLILKSTVQCRVVPGSTVGETVIVSVKFAVLPLGTTCDGGLLVTIKPRSHVATGVTTTGTGGSASIAVMIAF